jgi:hypothetical protein
VRLITLNCGLPDDDAILRLAPERYILRLCRVLPVTVGYAAAFRAMDLLERQLARRFERILKIAPPSDRVSLKSLLKKTLAHRRELKVRSELP